MRPEADKEAAEAAHKIAEIASIRERERRADKLTASLYAGRAGLR